jgi:class 3 adenylate cyclase
MMSTGAKNKIHASKAVARALLSVGVELHGVQVEYRGLTFVKGKGELPTFWLQRRAADNLPERAAVERTLRLELLARNQEKASDVSGVAAMHMLVQSQPDQRSRAPLPKPVTADVSASALAHIGTANSGSTVYETPAARVGVEAVPRPSVSANAALPDAKVMALIAASIRNGPADHTHLLESRRRASSGGKPHTVIPIFPSEDHAGEAGSKAPVAVSTKELRNMLRQVQHSKMMTITETPHRNSPALESSRGADTARRASRPAPLVAMMPNKELEDVTIAGAPAGNTVPTMFVAPSQRYKVNLTIAVGNMRPADKHNSSSTSRSTSAASSSTSRLPVHVPTTARQQLTVLPELTPDEGDADASPRLQGISAGEALARRYMDRVVLQQSTAITGADNAVSVVAESVAASARGLTARFNRIKEDVARPQLLQPPESQTKSDIRTTVLTQSNNSPIVCTPTVSLPVDGADVVSQRTEHSTSEITHRSSHATHPPTSVRSSKRPSNSIYAPTKRPLTQTAAAVGKKMFSFGDSSTDPHPDKLTISAHHHIDVKSEDPTVLAERLNDKLFDLPFFQNLSPLQRMQLVQRILDEGHVATVLQHDITDEDSLQNILRTPHPTSPVGPTTPERSPQPLRDASAALKPARGHGQNEPQAWEFKPKLRTKSMRIRLDPETDDALAKPTGPLSSKSIRRIPTSAVPLTDNAVAPSRRHSIATCGVGARSSRSIPTSPEKSKIALSADTLEGSAHQSKGEKPTISAARSLALRASVRNFSNHVLSSPSIGSVWQGELQMSSEERGSPTNMGRRRQTQQTQTCCCPRRLPCRTRVAPAPTPTLPEKAASPKSQGSPTRTACTCSWSSYDLTFPDASLEQRMQVILQDGIMSSCLTVIAIIGIALMLSCVPSYFVGIRGGDESLNLQGTWAVILGVFFVTSWAGVKQTSSAPKKARTVWMIAGFLVFLAFANSLVFHVLALRNYIQTVAHAHYIQETMLEVPMWYFMPLIGWSQLSLFLRLSFKMALVGSSSMFVLATIILLSTAPDDSREATAFGLVLVFANVCVTCFGCLFREMGSRSYFASFVAATAAEADSNQILQNLLPAQVVKPIMLGQDVLSQVHGNCAILFADLAGFTRMASSMDPNRLMVVLNTIYTRFDDMVEQRGLWKAETIGDAYIAVAGLFEPRDAAASSTATSTPAYNADAAKSRVRLESLFDLASAMQRELASFRKEIQLEIHMRIGIHIGDVVTGIVGSHRPRFGKDGISNARRCSHFHYCTHSFVVLQACLGFLSLWQRKWKEWRRQILFCAVWLHKRHTCLQRIPSSRRSWKMRPWIVYDHYTTTSRCYQWMRLGT